MEKYALYRLSHDGRQIDILGRPSVTSDTSIINLVFIQKMFATDRFPEHHRALVNYYNHILTTQRTPLILDAGANIGAASIYFSETYSGARVYGIEPDAENYALLEANMKGRDFVGIQGALSSENGILCLNTEDFGPISYRTGQTGDTKVQAYGLLDLIARAEKDGKILLVKIDIEGAEEEVFSKDSGFLRDIPLIVMEPHDWMIPFKGSSQNFYRELSRHNFDVLLSGENIFCFNNDILTKFLSPAIES